MNRLYVSRGVVVLYVWLALVMNCHASDNLWEMLDRDGNALDLMAIESEDNRVLLVGARYEEQQWQPEDEPIAENILLPNIRKQLHIISIDAQEKIQWQHSYPAIPDVGEIYSVKATPNGHLCIAYGRNYEASEFINPVVLQIDSAGKIVWANTQSIPDSYLPEPSSVEYTQIANLESIRIVDTDNNGCVMSYILRHQTANSESFFLNLVMFDKGGNHQWHFSHETDLYGKTFLVRDRDANHFTAVQTNQSRDAAIEAMMAGRPFSPQTNILLVTPAGKLQQYLQHENLKILDKVWIKHIVDSPGSSILLVGNKKNAWAGLVDEKGSLNKVYNALEGEFGYVNKKQPDGYVLIRGDSIELVDMQLNLQMDKPITQVIKKKYINAFLEKRLTEVGPIQNIVPLRKDAYLILYKLGSRLQKIEF